MTKTAVGRGYSILYPCFDGEGYVTVNRFYETLRKCAEEYFQSIIEEDRRSICRAVFSVEDETDTFTVSITLTLRRCGRRYGERILTHRWRRWNGRDAVLER